jgi:hypothetical protein
MTVIEATQLFTEADTVWRRHVRKCYPRIMNAPYLPVGRGVPGSTLRTLYEAREAAQKEYNAAWQALHTR